MSTSTEHLVTSVSASGDYKLVVNELWCKGCRICVDLCPQHVLEMVEAPERWEGTVVKVAKMDSCNGCGICEVECPDFAIGLTSTRKKKTNETAK